MRARIAILAVIVALCAAHAAPAQSMKIVVTPQVMRESGSGWNFTFRYPTFSVPGALMGVRGTMGDINNHMKAVGQKLLSAFKSDIAEYGTPPAEFAKMKSVVDAKYQVVTNRGGVISVRWDAYQMMAGAAHPVTREITANWLSNVGFVTVPDLFKPGSDGLQRLSRSALAQLQAKAKKGGYELISTEGASPKADNFTAFALTRGGVRIYFQYAQVAPGVAGNLDVEVPWSALKPALKPLIWKQISAL